MMVIGLLCVFVVDFIPCCRLQTADLLLVLLLFFWVIGSWEGWGLKLDG